MSKKVRRIKIGDKEYSLNDIWRLCVDKMWKDIHTTHKYIPAAKEEWTEAHGFSDAVYSECFFCEWNKQTGIKDRCGDVIGCDACPGKLVSKRFSCRDEAYNYCRQPRKFYRKVFQLNEKRKNH